MRLFLAIELPQTIKRKLTKQLRPLQQEYPYIKWTSPENYHLTLHFFGDEKPEFLKQILEEILYDAQEFYMYSSRADLFIKDNITIYIGFQRNKPLEKIAREIKERSAQGTSRKFIPHLTVGRYKIPSKQQYFLLKKKLQNLPVDIEFKVDKLILFDSILGKPKPTYKQITEFPLLAKA